MSEMMVFVFPTPEIQATANPGKFALVYCVSTKFDPAFKSCEALGAVRTAGADTIGVNTRP